MLMFFVPYYLAFASVYAIDKVKYQSNAVASVGDQLDEFVQEGLRKSLNVLSDHVNERVSVAV